MRELKRAKVIYPGPPMSADTYPLELRLNDKGITRLVELDTLQIEVYGPNGYAFCIWPANVVWAEAYEPVSGPKDVVLAGACSSPNAVVHSDVSAPSVADPAELSPQPPTLSPEAETPNAGLASLAPTSEFHEAVGGRDEVFERPFVIDSGVAQPVVHVAVNDEDGSSNLSAGAKKPGKFNRRRNQK